MEGERDKVFCVGFQKTGTSSMRIALEKLGYRVAGVFGEDSTLDELRQSYVEQGLQIARTHDAVEDMPWPLLFRELDEHFPEAKFILTTREPSRWIGSMSSHFRNKMSVTMQLVYGKQPPDIFENPEFFTTVFENHNADVHDYFLNWPGKLLVMSLEDGDGWEKLGAFLGLPDVPDGPFVHANSASERRSFSYRLKRKLIKLGLPVKQVSR